jgi:hypothetical protein
MVSVEGGDSRTLSHIVATYRSPGDDLNRVGLGAEAIESQRSGRRVVAQQAMDHIPMVALSGEIEGRRPTLVAVGIVRQRRNEDY